MSLRRPVVLCIGLFLSIRGLTAQEHSYTPADIENGAKLYQSSCAGCHGPSGDAIPGINLGRGQFRRATTDSELIAIIQKGIPNTAMPPSSFSEAQAGQLVAYLRTTAASVAGASPAAAALPGNPTRGKALFEGKADCDTCHRVNGVGARLAPDLSEVGAIRPIAELQQSLLEPSAVMRAGNRFVRVVTKDGATITGRLLNQDSFSIQLLDSKEQLVSLSKANLREHGFVKESPMPSYRDKLSSEEVADLVSYLFSLKGQR